MATSVNLAFTTTLYTDFVHGPSLLSSGGTFVTTSWSSTHTKSFMICLSLTNSDSQGLDHPISIYTRVKHSGTELHQYFLNKFWIPYGTTYNVFTRSAPLWLHPGYQSGDFMGLYYDHGTADKINAHLDYWRVD